MTNALDFGPIYTSTGGIAQIEYAQKCADNGNTCICLKTKTGIFIFVERPISKLLINSNSIYKLTDKCIVAMSGLLSDTKWPLQEIKETLIYHKKYFGSEIDKEIIKSKFTSITSIFTKTFGLRVLGVNFLLALNYKDEYHVLSSDCTSKMRAYKSWAIGKGASRAKTELEKIDLEQLSDKQAIEEGIRIMYLTHDPLKDMPFEVEICSITKDNDNQIKWLEKNEFEEFVQKFQELTVDD
ncbi:putative proteasome subunit alpha type-7 [Dictyocoela muelleri]|nr:putative proteasome subunit alpha type-7 [Dictyocoela muelleri]